MQFSIEASIRRRAVLGTCLVATLLSGGASEAQSAADAWPPSPAGARSGAFGVAQFATTQPNAVMAAWRKPTAGVSVHTVRSVRFGQPVTTFVIFRGCTADRQGRCDIRADVAIDPPSGEVGVPAKIDVWKGPAPQREHIQISRQSVTVVFDKPDPPGTYLVRTTVTDRVAGITLKTQERLSVLPR